MRQAGRQIREPFADLASSKQFKLAQNFTRKSGQGQTIGRWQLHPKAGARFPAPGCKDKDPVVGGGYGMAHL